MERLTVALEPLIYDETTGLPKLPEGYAWKVRENEYSGYEVAPDETALVIQIAKRQEEEKLTWFQRLIGVDPEVKWTAYDHEYSEGYGKCANDADDLKSAATQVYNELRDSQLKRAEMQKLIGLYPPKSIL
jgi:hypothetical protein